jgi:hypothetical protein
MYKLTLIMFLVLSSSVFANKVNTDDKLTFNLEKKQIQNDFSAVP